MEPQARYKRGARAPFSKANGELELLRLTNGKEGNQG